MKKIKITVLFLALLQTFSAVSQSTKIKNLENQRAQIKKEIIEINNLLSSNKKQKNLTFRDLEILAAKINTKESLIKINNDQKVEKLIDRNTIIVHNLSPTALSIMK